MIIATNDAQPVMRKPTLRCLLGVTMIVILLHACGHEQTPPSSPEAGKPMPDFTLHNVQGYRKSTVSLSDFKGRWLFLSFWYRGCETSITTLPQINGLTKKYSDKAEFILVGANSRRSFGNGIIPLYERLRSKMQLEIPFTFDSALTQRWEIYSFPRMIIVNPQGIVAAHTHANLVTEEKVDQLLRDQHVSFPPFEWDRPAFDPGKLTDSSERLIYRSTIAGWQDEQMHVPSIASFVNDTTQEALQITRAPLHMLYNIAYAGEPSWSLMRDSLYDKVYPVPLLETKNPDAFSHDYETGKGRYNFHMVIPRVRRNAADVAKLMQMQLKNAFGYEVSLEVRTMPVWNLVANSQALQRLKTKGGLPDNLINMDADGGVAGFKFRNYPFGGFLERVTKYIDDNKIPYFDETGIRHNIDITFDALLTDRDQVLQELRRHGLNLVKGERKMMVLVIRDPD